MASEVETIYLFSMLSWLVLGFLLMFGYNVLFIRFFFRARCEFKAKGMDLSWLDFMYNLRLGSNLREISPEVSKKKILFIISGLLLGGFWVLGAVAIVLILGYWN